MALELSNTSIVAQTRYAGAGSYVVPAGRSLKIESTPGGEEIFDIETPAGKSRVYRINLDVIETDA